MIKGGKGGGGGLGSHYIMLPLRYCRLTMFGSVHIEWGKEYLGKVTWCYDRLGHMIALTLGVCMGHCYLMVCFFMFSSYLLLLYIYMIGEN